MIILIGRTGLLNWFIGLFPRLAWTSLAAWRFGHNRQLYSVPRLGRYRYPTYSAGIDRQWVRHVGVSPSQVHDKQHRGNGSWICSTLQNWGRGARNNKRHRFTSEKRARRVLAQKQHSPDPRLLPCRVSRQECALSLLQQQFGRAHAPCSMSQRSVPRLCPPPSHPQTSPIHVHTEYRPHRVSKTHHS